MSIQLSDHFNFKKLLKLTFPSVVMLVVTSLYSIVDGYFVSNYAGKSAFAAVNFIIPFLIVIGSVGFLMGTGGGALIAKTMGEGRPEKANKIFSMVIYVSVAVGVIITVIGFVFMPQVAAFLGAEGELLENSVRYGRIVLLANPAYILQFEFQCLFATANKPSLGLFVTLAAGITNALLDVIFVGILPLGLEGAAAATCIGQCVGGIIPIIYFARKNNSLLRLGKPYFNGRELLQICLNGSSEMMSNISSAIVGMLYNIQLMKYLGEDGVAAYGVLMYVGMIFSAIFIGFSVGTSPVISYHYGAENRYELKNLKRRCLILVTVFSGCMFALSLGLSVPLSIMFVGYDAELFEMTRNAFFIYSFSFLFFGFTIFTSSFFTALNNGPVSAGISFLRTAVFQVAAVLLLPLIFDKDGIWLSIVAAELFAIFTSFVILRVFKKKYGY